MVVCALVTQQIFSICRCFNWIQLIPVKDNSSDLYCHSSYTSCIASTCFYLLLLCLHVAALVFGWSGSCCPGVLLPFIIQISTLSSYSCWILTHYSNERHMQLHNWCTIRPLRHTTQLQASDPLMALWSLDSNLESALHTTQQMVSAASLIDIAGLGRSLHFSWFCSTDCTLTLF